MTKHRLCRNELVNSTRPRFLSCYIAVRQVLRTHAVERVARVSNTTFCALSFYVDRAIDTKLVGKRQNFHVFTRLQSCYALRLVCGVLITLLCLFVTRIARDFPP